MYLSRSRGDRTALVWSGAVFCPVDREFPARSPAEAADAPSWCAVEGDPGVLERRRKDGPPVGNRGLMEAPLRFPGEKVATVMSACPQASRQEAPHRASSQLRAFRRDREPRTTSITDPKTE